MIEGVGGVDAAVPLFYFIGNYVVLMAKKKRMFVEHTLDKVNEGME